MTFWCSIFPPHSHFEINSFQRFATVVFQLSIREGFGLVVSEAMWGKKKPVIGSNVGGIKRQVLNGITGFLVTSQEDAAYRERQLLADQQLRERMGFYAKERVKTPLFDNKTFEGLLNTYNVFNPLILLMIGRIFTFVV